MTYQNDLHFRLRGEASLTTFAMHRHLSLSRFAQFIRICRWLQLIHKERLAPL